MQDEIRRCQEKEEEFQRLLQAKAEKMANKYLGDKEHTQLSYLPKDKAEYHISVPKRILLEKLISILNRV